MDDHGLMPSGCRVVVGIGGSGIVESFLSNGVRKKVARCFSLSSAFQLLTEEKVSHLS